jgi:hypothetical protein
MKNIILLAVLSFSSISVLAGEPNTPDEKKSIGQSSISVKDGSAQLRIEGDSARELYYSLKDAVEIYYSNGPWGGWADRVGKNVLCEYDVYNNSFSCDISFDSQGNAQPSKRK